jgi:hypothetical protein
VDWSEHRAAHELVGLGQIYPAHLGQLLLVADEGLGSASRAGSQVDIWIGRMDQALHLGEDR